MVPSTTIPKQNQPGGDSVVQLEMAFEDTKTALAVVAASLDAIAPTPRESRQRKTNRGRLPAHLQRVEQVVDIENRTCVCCGGALQVIAEDVSEQLDVVSTTFSVFVTRRPRYGCLECETAPAQAAVPAHIIDGGLRSEAFVPRCWCPNMPTTCPYTRRRRSAPARARILTVRCWPTGPARAVW